MELASVKLFTFLVAISAATAVDYCSLCSNHIACQNSGKFASSCPSDAQMVKLSNLNIQTLLNAHNNARNIIAGGGVAQLQSASQMMTLQWDVELAYLAGLNVKQCTMAHDGCRISSKYEFPGQNLYWSGASSFGNINNALNSSVQAWYNEKQDVIQSDIDQCCGGGRFSAIGHFLQLAQDRAVAIGCAASRYTKDGWKTTLIACNYSFGNMLDDPVYTEGTAASNCTKGRNPIYTNLCK